MAYKLTNEDFLKMLNEAGLYTIDQLQTAGQSHIHWENLTNVPPEFGGENTFVHLDDTPSNIIANYKLVGNATGTGLIFIEDSKDGTDGKDGREVELQKTATYIQWRLVDTPEQSWQNLVLLSELKGDKGDKGDNGETGTPAKNILLQKTIDRIEWKLEGDASWQLLVLLSAITGPAGSTGSQGIPGIDGINGIPGTQFYLVDTIPTSEIGIDNDLSIDTSTWDLYKKVTGAWVLQGNIKGEKGDIGLTGNNGADGIDGLNISIVSAIPLNTFGNNGDSALNKNDGTLYEKADDAWAIVGSLKGVAGSNGTNGVDGEDGNIYHTTSTTTIDLSTEVVGNSITLTVDPDLSYSSNQLLVISSSISLYFVGKVISYTTNQLVVSLKYKIGATSSSLWEINLAGMAEATIVEKWYTITATAGATASDRTYSGPDGWVINTSDDPGDLITTTDLGSNATDLTVEHSTGYSCVECIIYTTSGSINTKLQGTAAYSTLRENTSHTALEIMGLATINQALTIYIKLI